MQLTRGRNLMSRSQARRESTKAMRPDSYYNDGIFELARFDRNILVKNNSTSEQRTEYITYLRTEYPAKYASISQKILAIQQDVGRCDPYDFLMHIRSMVLMTQINMFSEFDYLSEAVAIIRAQEYIQSIIVSAENKYDSTVPDDIQEKLHTKIIQDFESLYKELLQFYHFWAAHIQETKAISNDRLNDIVEVQHMYWVRGNRFQAFELEPLKSLLPPHTDVLQELFGVSASEVISGLKKLQYTLTQGCIDAMISLGDQYEIFQNAVQSGANPQKAIEDAQDRSLNLVEQVFGGDLIDVALVTGWDSRFIDAFTLDINEYRDRGDQSEFSGWPIIELPVMRKPFIWINGKTYAFLYYALFDNIYRNIQKSIMQLKPEYSEKWKKLQTYASEDMVKQIFLKLLPGAKAYVGNYYPVKTSLKQMNENDIIIVYQNYLFIIEVKAGSFPTSPPITDFDAHIKAYRKLAEAADSQCSRTLDYIKKHTPAQFYDCDKRPTCLLPSVSSFDDVFTFSVTVDYFNEFAAKAEKLSVISLKETTIVISYDDLLGYAAYFNSSIRFLHYLKQRKAAMTIPQFQMHDEFDHLGLYIDKNLYALNPSQYEAVRSIHFYGFRQKLDVYFSQLHMNPSRAEKPIQIMPKEISEILDYLDCHPSIEAIRLAHFLMDLSTDAKELFSEQIKYALVRQKERNYSIPLMAIGEIKYCAFITMSDIIPYTVSEQLDYTYASASRNEKIPVMWISLEYDKQNALVAAQGKKCSLSDLERDEIERIKILGQKKANDWVELYITSHGGHIGRNEYCPCGSGKKYKFCCLASQE